MTALCWFRTDLRTLDNPALTAAAVQSGPSGTVKTGNDDYYRVFTPFSKACRIKLKAVLATHLTSLANLSAQALPKHMLPTRCQHSGNY